MKISLKLLFIPLYLYCGLMSTAWAQRTAIYDQPDAEFRDAQDLFIKEKFGAAQQKYLQVVRMTQGDFSELSAQSKYYAAMCAVQLFNDDADYLVVNYVRNHPEHILVNNAWYELGRYHFRFKRYKDAIGALEKVDKGKLKGEELDEYNFKFAYCAFMRNDMETAKAAFTEVKEGKYYAGATYYFGHIAYAEKNYETALKSFKKISSDDTYGKFTPYYITQIYYIQEKYDELLKVAPGLMDSATSKRAPEIARMIGSAYYKTKQYKEAIHYYQVFFDKTEGRITRDDHYELAYCYFQTGDYQNAAKYFSLVRIEEGDLLSQVTLYNLGICKMKTPAEKMDALQYFLSAYKLNVDPAISENALFNFAKLGYETGYNAYNKTIESFQSYIKEYPQSGHVDEAYEYLSELYLSTKNYKDALLSMESIKNRDVRTNRAYQKICYYRGVELFNDGKLDEAKSHFGKALKVQVDPSVTALSVYWSGEVYYRQGDLDSAQLCYQHFKVLTAASGLPEYTMAHYNLGYCFFKKKDYTAALPAFKDFLAESKKEVPKIVNDACLRAADCYFMKKEYEMAVEYYDKSIAMKLADQDYAMYQKALAYGPMGKFDQKANILSDFVKKFPKSDYLDDALYEAGRTYQNIGNDQKAILCYDQLVKDCPKSAYVSQALLKKGLLYYTMRDSQTAITLLKQVVNDFRGTPEAKQALVTLEKIHLELDRVPDYVNYLASLGEQISDILNDSLTYAAVENKYMNNDCANAITGFADYIKRFPNGQFIMVAQFYKAECELEAGNLENALQGYLFIMDKPRTKFTEASLFKACRIQWDLKKFEDALATYIKLGESSQEKQHILDARVGVMRCNYSLNRLPEAISAARIVLTTDKLPEELVVESHMVIGRSAMALDSLATAVAEFTTVSQINKSEMAAEAKWNLGYIQFVIGDYVASEKIAYDLINQVPSYDYWVAKAHILLAENAYKMGNAEFAKQILESVIEHYEGVDLKEEAQKKKMEILEAEKQEDLLKQQQQQQQQNDGQSPDVINPGSF